MDIIKKQEEIIALLNKQVELLSQMCEDRDKVIQAQDELIQLFKSRFPNLWR